MNRASLILIQTGDSGHCVRQPPRSFQYPDLSERDVLLGFWAKAHGLACLLVANPDWFAPESLESGLARVMRNAF